MFSIFVIPGPYDRDDGKVPESIGALGGRKDCRIEGRAEEERKSAPSDFPEENLSRSSTTSTSTPSSQSLPTPSFCSGEFKLIAQPHRSRKSLQF